MLHIHLLGGFRLDFAGRMLPDPPTRRARSLLAYLVIHQRQKHARDRLAGVFWPDMPDSQARRRLSQSLWRIGLALKEATPEHAYVRVEGDAIWFDRDAPHWLDVAALERAWREVREQKNAGAKALERWERAAMLYRGDFMAGHYDDWILTTRERFFLHYLDVLKALAAAFRRNDQSEKALDYARLLVAQEPLDEDAQAQVMELLHRLGHNHAALQQYEQLCILLSRELGVGPSPPVVALFQKIRRGLPHATDQPPPGLLSPSPLLEEGKTLRMVGRCAERARIEAMLERTSSRGQGGILLIAGAPGVGKSKLIEVIAEDAVWRGFQVCSARSTEQDRESYFSLFQELFRMAVTPMRREQLQHMLPDVWFREIAPLLPGADEESMGGIAGEKQFFSAIGRTLQTLGEIKPHLLILEDLHWTDESALNLLTQLAPTLAKSNVLIIGSFRTEEAQENDSLWPAFQALFLTDGVVRIHLRPLDVEEVEMLIREALGLRQRVQHLARRIWQAAGGNPLFLLETLSSLYEAGLLYRDQSGAWAMPWAQDEYARIPIPEQIFQVITRRFENLSAEQWQVASAAAVLGPDCAYALLRAVSGLADAAVLTSVRTLIERRLLLERESGYRFVHDQIHAVAYGLIEESERRVLHDRAAVALESAHPHRVATLARHWQRAEVWEKAAHYHLLAGRRARRSYARQVALTHSQQALAAWRRLDAGEEALQLEILEEKAMARRVMGPFDAAERDFQQTRRLARRLGVVSTETRALNQLSYLHFQRGDYEAALKRGREAQATAQRIARSDARESLLAWAFLNQANALRNSGHYEESIIDYTRAVAGFERCHEQRHLADALNRMGYALQMVGRLDAAREQLERTLALRRQIGDLMGVSYSLINLSALANRTGDFRLSIRHCQEAEAIAETIADPYGQDAALGNRGSAYLELGDFHQAQSLLHQAAAIGEAIGDQPMLISVLDEMGRLYLKTGRVKQAIETLRQALTHPSGERASFISIHMHLAEALANAGDAEHALDHARIALSAAEESRGLFYLGEAARVWAQMLAQSEGANATIRDWFEKSIHLLETMQARAEWARSLEAYGRYLSAKTNAAERERGQKLRELARESFRALGMAWDLAQSVVPSAVSSPTQVWERLPSVRTRRGRPLQDCEHVDVLWTLHRAEDDMIHAKAARRQRIILRLVEEARQQDASPTVAALARALSVSERTIKRDLAALRKEGHPVKLFGNK